MYNCHFPLADPKGKQATGIMFDSRCDTGAVNNREDMKTNYIHLPKEGSIKNFASVEIRLLCKKNPFCRI